MNAPVTKTKRKPTGAAAMGPGPGRPKGSHNKVTRELKDMILAALDKSGGIAYLTERANDPKTAGAFLTLLGKVLPMQLSGDPDAPLQVHIIAYGSRQDPE